MDPDGEARFKDKSDPTGGCSVCCAGVSRMSEFMVRSQQSCGCAQSPRLQTSLSFILSGN